MLESCKKCIFYDKDYDEMRQSGDDTVVVGEKQIDKHYCRMYDSHIDEAIVNDEKKCEYFAE